MRYAIVKNGKVINTVLWDGVATWLPEKNTQAVQLSEDSTAGIGWDFIDGEFIDNRPPVEEEI